MTRLCFVAAPLIARSGVYRSTIELVAAARAEGLPWEAVVGVSAQAGGERFVVDGVTELTMEPSGPSGILNLSRTLRALPAVAAADLVITMVPQSDMALALGSTPWVAYLRGLPWPAPGEGSTARSLVWKQLEKLALRRAKEVWVTTRQLSRDIGGLDDRLVAPGLLAPTPSESSADADLFVWAARYSADKNPDLFLRAMDGLETRGVMYGSGPLEDRVREAAPGNVEVPGWVERSHIWGRARAYVGTSTREAFGRSAVEAAMLGIPPIISDQFGCAEHLYTDGELIRTFVLPVNDVDRWRRTIRAVAEDDELRAAAAAHVKRNAEALTVEAAVRNVAAAAAAVAGRVGA